MSWMMSGSASPFGTLFTLRGKQRFPHSNRRLLAVCFQLPSDKRELLLLETLKVKWTTLDPVPDSLRLPVAVSCYWLQHPEVQAKLLHVEALLLGMLVGPLHAMIDGPDTEDERGKGAETLYRDLCAVKARTRLSGRVDLDAAHVFCQWQSCLQMALYLNQLLSSPFPEPDLTCLYNGSLVHGLCHELLPTASAASLLSTCPEAKQLYELLFHAMQPYAPPEVFQPKSRSHSKKKRQKKQGISRSKTRAGTASGTGCLYKGSNRFTLLMDENLEAVEPE